MKRILFLLLAAMLAGCAPAFDRPAFLATLVGQPEAEVIRRLGVPSRTYETDGRKFLAYSERQSDLIGGGPFFGGFGSFGSGFGGSGLGFGYSAAFPTQIVERDCETTFEVAGGRVLAWSLRGNAC